LKKKWKLKEGEKYEIIVKSIVGLLCLAAFYFVTSFIVKPFSILVAVSIKNGFFEIFKGDFNLIYFSAAIFFIFVIFFYVSLFFLLFFLITEYKYSKKSFFDDISISIKSIMEKKLNVFYFILTLIISITIMSSGMLFLAEAFPAEPLFFKGVLSNDGSKLQCNQEGYLNIISTWDLPCEISLSDKYKDKEIHYAEISYNINRIEIKENISWNSKDMITLYYDKEKQPQFLKLHFTGNSEEIFVIYSKGVYTKEEYFKREREKAVWFFAIISFSLFSVFVAMNNIKQILGWK